MCSIITKKIILGCSSRLAEREKQFNLIPVAASNAAVKGLRIATQMVTLGGKFIESPHVRLEELFIRSLWPMIKASETGKESRI